MEHDPVKYALWIGGFSLFAAILCGLYIVYVNSGSRNLMAALFGLFGAGVFFASQIWYELKGTTTSSDFGAEYIVDYRAKTIKSARAYDQSVADPFGVFLENAASKIFAAAAPPFKIDDDQKIARDFAMVSLISYLVDQQPDWQLDARSFKTDTRTSSQFVSLSKPDERTVITVGDIRKKLEAAANIFASAPIGTTEIAGIGGSTLFLPPNGAIDVSTNSVTLRSGVGSIVLTLNPNLSFTMGKDPQAVANARAAKQPIEALPNADSDRFRKVTIAVRATIEFAALRAQSPDLEKYKKWTDRVVQGVKAGF